MSQFLWAILYKLLEGFMVLMLQEEFLSGEKDALLSGEKDALFIWRKRCTSYLEKKMHFLSKKKQHLTLISTVKNDSGITYRLIFCLFVCFLYVVVDVVVVVIALL